jgi:hypothetical protein
MKARLDDVGNLPIPMMSAAHGGRNTGGRHQARLTLTFP